MDAPINTTDAANTSDPSPKTQQRYMRMALALARKAQGHAEPNPMVGAVIVKNNVILGKGYHQRFGEPHAEVNAIADARKHGHDITAADIYVTLEPCSHFGKTPPCANAILDAKLARVFCAMVDPFPQVSGKGINRLQDHGVTVHTGILESEARELNGPWLKRLATGLPRITLKWAQSVDGKIAASTGDSQWISGPSARKLVHQIRGRVDAVIVGIGTALADDPQLTARDVKPRRIAQRVIIDPHLKLPDECKLLTPDPKTKEGKQGKVSHIIIATSTQAMTKYPDRVRYLQEIGVDVQGLDTFEPYATQSDKKGSGVFVSQDISREKQSEKRCQVPLISHPQQGPQTTPLATELNLKHLFQYLVTKHDATNILVEGGGRLHGSLIHQNLVDQMLIFISPKIIGDDQARSGIAGLSCPTMAQAKQLTLHQSKQIGQDMLLDYRVK